MKVVCFGDSLTSCGGPDGRYSDILAQRFPGHEFVNAGVGGETFVDARQRLQSDVLDLRPDVVLIEFGANDWWQDERPPADWAHDLQHCICEVRKSGAVPVVLGVFGDALDDNGHRVPKTRGTDERAIAYREMEASVAARHGCPYVPNIQERILANRNAWRDRNHPNEFGNRAVADTIERHLATLLGQGPLPVRKPVLHTILDFWDEAVALAPDRPAAVDGDRTVTFAEADRAARGIAARLLEASGGSPPRVVAFLPNCLEYFLLYWGIMRAGGMIVPLNTWLKPDSLQAICRRVQPHALVYSPACPETVLGAAREAGAGEIVPVDEFSRLTAPPSPECPAIPPSPEDVAVVMHTSGTTATPKGAVMRHSDLIFNVMAAINAHRFSPLDVHLLINPMFHCTALYTMLPMAAYTKTPLVITADSSPAGLLELVQRHRTTTLLSVPTVFQRLVAHPELARYDTTSLRVLGYAGSMMPVNTIQALRDRFPEVALHNFFGMTETTSMTHVLSGDDALERPDSVGRLLPFVEAIVVDNQLRPVEPGTVGELLFARENVISEYYLEPGRLEKHLVQVDARLWFRSGDLASVDEDGYFYVRGREKDMIIVGGENVFASEVEAVLCACPGVREAAVVGVPATGVRASLGETIRAVVVRDDDSLTERTLRAHCMKRLPSYKQPHHYEFRQDLPRNPSGKVVKGELSARCSA